MSCNRFYHERRKPLFSHKSFFNLKQGVRKFKVEIYNHVYHFYMIRHTRAFYISCLIDRMRTTIEWLMQYWKNNTVNAELEIKITHMFSKHAYVFISKRPISIFWYYLLYHIHTSEEIFHMRLCIYTKQRTNFSFSMSFTFKCSKVK